MYCHMCGNKLDRNDKFCDKCGAKQTVSPEIQTVKINTDKTVTEKKSNIIWVVLLILIVISFIILGIMSGSENKKRVYEKDNAIQEVKNAHFAFLDGITVGDLLYEYYGADNWTCFSDNEVQFWGTNRKDNSGMALHFSEVAPDNTVQVTYIKYHEEDEEAHDIIEKEFETYILGLYDQLSSKNITTQSTQTTTTKTTPEVTTTAVTAKAGNPEQSEYYFGYLVFLKGIDRAVKEEHDNTGLINYRYYLYDINKDGFYELIVHIGESEGDSYILICTVDEENKDAFVEVGGLYGSHTSFIEKDGKLCTYFRSSGYQSVDAIRIVNEQGVWSVVQEKLFEQESSSEYKDYDTLLKGYDISDTDAVEKICPPELLDEEYINSWVEKVVEEINDNF